MKEPQIVSAVIAVAGVIFSAILSFLVSYLHGKFSYRQLFVDNVTKNRIEWINIWRENIAIFLANAETLKTYSKLPNKENVFNEMLKAKGMITTRLNLDEPLHNAMWIAINSFDYTSNNFIFQREGILELERKILKLEWEKSKKESKFI